MYGMFFPSVTHITSVRLPTACAALALYVRPLSVRFGTMEPCGYCTSIVSLLCWVLVLTR